MQISFFSLNDYVASTYVDLDHDPNTSIGALQAIEEHLNVDEDGTLFDASKDALRYFLLKYFSTMVVMEVMEVYQEVQDSAVERCHRYHT